MEAMEELVASRELDATVAEKVMGFCLHRPGYTYDLTHAERECTRCGGMFPDMDFDEQGSFKPSTDIAAAWQVVEHLRQQGWTMTLNAEDSSLRNPYDCRLFHSDGRRKIQIAATAPLAICLAALSTVE